MVIPEISVRRARASPPVPAAGRPLPFGAVNLSINSKPTYAGRSYRGMKFESQLMNVRV